MTITFEESRDRLLTLFQFKQQEGTYPSLTPQEFRDYKLDIENVAETIFQNNLNRDDHFSSAVRAILIGFTVMQKISPSIPDDKSTLSVIAYETAQYELQSAIAFRYIEKLLDVREHTPILKDVDEYI